MAIGDDLQGDVADALAEFGRDVSLRKVTAGTYDPATGATPAPTTKDYATLGLLLGYKDSVVNNTIIKQGDRKCILKVQGLSVAPDIGDRLIVGTDSYSIISFKTVEIGGVVVIYILQVRK